MGSLFTIIIPWILPKRKREKFTVRGLHKRRVAGSVLPYDGALSLLRALHSLCSLRSYARKPAPGNTDPSALLILTTSGL
jgi:hypothetical protein